MDQENIAVLKSEEDITSGHVMTLEEADAGIRNGLKDAARSVIIVGYYLKGVRDHKLYLTAGYVDIWEYAAATFGFSKSTASRYMKRNDKFSVGGNSPVLADEYRDYSKAQLQEMLNLDAEQLEDVTPGMTVREIRELKRPRELPYYDIPGQLNISDFPGMDDAGDDPDAAVDVEETEELIPARGSFSVTAEDLIEDETECVAMSQQEESETLPNCGGNAAEKQRYPMDDYGFREKRCNELARKLISDWKSWFGQDYQNRVLNVVESEKQIKEKIKGYSNRTWWLKSDDGEMMHVNLFDKYIQFWGKDFLGNCEWFYLCAAIQSMWNVIALEDTQKIVKDLNSVACELDSTPPDPERTAEPADYNRDQLESMILDAKARLECMGEGWKMGQAEFLCTKYMMMIQAYELLLKSHEAAEPEPEEEKAEQPELPRLKNNDQRAAFVDDYESWPLWIDNQETGEKYYRYDLPDGTSFVVKVYHAMIFLGWEVESGSRYEEGYGLSEQYILKPGKFFRDCRTNRSAMIEKLKELQKSE